MAKKSPQGERTTNTRKSLTRFALGPGVGYHEGSDVDYADVQYAQTDGVIRGDGTTAQSSRSRTKGKG